MPLSGDSKRTLAKLATADARKPIRKELQQGTLPIAPGIRTKIRSAGYGKASSGHGLRSALAKGITRTVKVTANGISIAVHAVRRGGLSNLASVAEGGKLWRHPTFGHSPTVDQPPLINFDREAEKYEPLVTKAMEKALSDYDKQF